MGSSNRLQDLRTERNWTRADLAGWLYAQGLTGRRGRFHERTVRRWENGESAIPDPVKTALCDLFGVSLDELMDR